MIRGDIVTVGHSGARLNLPHRRSLEERSGGRSQWAELGAKPAVLATDDCQEHLAPGRIGGVTRAAYHGTDALHFAVAATECRFSSSSSLRHSVAAGVKCRA